MISALRSTRAIRLTRGHRRAPPANGRRPSHATEATRSGARAVALQRVARLGLSYALDPRATSPGHRAGHPPRLARSATRSGHVSISPRPTPRCASTIASMPLLVVGNGHALVAVTLGANVRDKKLPGSVTETPGMLRVKDLNMFEAVVRNSLHAVECTDATTRLDTDDNPLPPTSFAQAEQDGVKEICAAACASSTSRGCTSRVRTRFIPLRRRTTGSTSALPSRWNQPGAAVRQPASAVHAAQGGTWHPCDLCALGSREEHNRATPRRRNAVRRRGSSTRPTGKSSSTVSRPQSSRR